MKKNFLNKAPAIAAVSLAILASIPSVATAATLSTLSSQAENHQLIAQACQNTEIRLSNNQNRVFAKGSNWSTCNGYSLRSQTDGNLVLYSPQGVAKWATGTEGRGATLVLQTDGNLVLYDAKNVPLWASDTSNNAGAFFSLQTDGNFVVYSSSYKPLWASVTENGRVGTFSASAIWIASHSQPSYSQKFEAFVNFARGQLGITRLDTTNYKGQCVTLIARYLQEVYLTGSNRTRLIALDNGGGTAQAVANQFGAYFLPTTRDGLPKRGAVVSFPQLGHTAIVMESRTLSNGQRQMRIMDSNGDNKAPNTQVKEYAYWINIPNGTANGYGNNIYWTNPR